MSKKAQTKKSNVQPTDEDNLMQDPNFQSIELQNGIMRIKNVLQFMKNISNSTAINSMDDETLQNKLQQISALTNQMDSCLDKQESVDNMIKNKSEQLRQLMSLYEECRKSNKISAIDKDIDRIMFKINLMRSVTKIFIMNCPLVSNDFKFEDSEELLDIAKRITHPRNITYYKNKLEKQQMS